MRYLISVLILFSLVSLSCKKDNPYKITNPESVVWNPVTKCYLISNAGSGYILSLKDKKEFEVFNKTKLTSPKGMAVLGNTLYVTDQTVIVSYNLKDGKELLRYPIPGAVGLNDIDVSPDGLVYASDMQGNAIVILDPKTKHGDKFRNPDLQTPNGVYYVQQDTTSLLYIVSFRPNAPVQILNLKTRKLSVVPNITVSLADGITRDNDGNWFISSWDAKKVFKYKPDFSEVTTMTDSFTSPADIYYNRAGKELAIPLFNTNQINFVSYIDKKAKPLKK